MKILNAIIKTVAPGALSLTLLGVLTLSTTASAYYDPGAQRWINRDPIGEEVAANLHSFVANRVPNDSEIDGRLSINGGLSILSALWNGACASYALQQSASHNFPSDGHEYKRHCLVGCLMKKCTGSYSSAMAGQLLKEIIFTLKDRRIDLNESIRDTIATALGTLFGTPPWPWSGDCRDKCNCPLLDS